MIEIWRDVKDFIGLYQVSNLGRVKRLISYHCKKERILKPRKGKHGYLYVILCKDGKTKTKTIHRLVAEAFLDNPNNLPEVNHLSEDKTDNRVENLCWSSKIDNINYGTGIERSTKGRINHWNISKTVLQFNLDGTFLQEFPSTMEVKRQLGFNESHISRCCLGKQKTSNGFIWRYKNDEQE